MPEPDKWRMNDTGADYVYSGKNPIDFMLPNGLKEILDYSIWHIHQDKVNKIPLFTHDEYLEAEEKHQRLNFLRIDAEELDKTIINKISIDPTLVLVLKTENIHSLPALRRSFFEMIKWGINNPVIVQRSYDNISDDHLQLYAATDIGGLLIDGLGDGVMLGTDITARGKNHSDLLEVIKRYNSTSFGILQAARTRMTKTEYISCPSCGRTLFDLQETTAMIRKRTDHLKGVKIGIMGCIVNGPGEMADADYGYVGSGKGKITLYKGKEVVKRGVPSERAVDELIEIIREDGNWIEIQETENA